MKSNQQMDMLDCLSSSAKFSFSDPYAPVSSKQERCLASRMCCSYHLRDSRKASRTSCCCLTHRVKNLYFLCYNFRPIGDTVSRFLHLHRMIGLVKTANPVI